MSSTFSNLKFELIGNGEQSGTWGTTTNSNIGTAIEQALVGMATLDSGDFTANVATLTLANTNAAQDARALCLNIASGAVSAAGTVNVPAIEKPYIIINGSSFTVTVKVSGQTGVAVPPGKRTVVYNNGTDVGSQINWLAALEAATLTTSGTVTLNGGTANGVAYLNGSKVLTTGSALTFDGTNFGVGTAPVAGYKAAINGDIWQGNTGGVIVGSIINNAGWYELGGSANVNGVQMSHQTTARWMINSSEQMRLTSTGLGIGTSSPGAKLSVNGNANLLAGGTLTFLNSANSAAGSIVCPGGGSLSLRAYGVEMVGLSENATLVFSTNSTERARIDSSGNLGLGVTPSAWSTNYPAQQIKNGSWIAYSGPYGGLSANAYFDQAGTNRYIITGEASVYKQEASVHKWLTAPSGTAGNAITFTQAMTLDASGNLLVGQTSGTYKVQAGRGSTSDGLQIAITNAGGAGTNASPQNMDLDFLGNANSLRARIRAIDQSFNASDSHLSFWTQGGAFAERVRISAGGDLLVGTTSQPVGGVTARLAVSQNAADYSSVFVSSQSTAGNCYGARIQYTNAAPNGTGNVFLVMNDTGGDRALFRSNGGLANYSGNNVNLSDRREKTNFAPAKSYLDTICAIPVQTFNYVDQNMENDPGLTLGVVAQDVQAVAPELVMESNWGTKEEPKMRLSIYQTDLQYALMKCIQEQQAIITALTARVASLESN